MGKRIGHDADLDVDRLIFHQPHQVRHFVAGVRPAFAPLALGQIETPGEAVLQQAADFGRGKQIDDGRAASGVGRLALREDLHDLRDVRSRALAIVDARRNAFAQDVSEPLMEFGRGEQVGDRPREHDDLARGLLDLPDSLEVRHGGRQEFDTDAEERRDGNAEQLRELLERLDLDQLAALESIDGRSRDVEAAGDLIGAQSGGKAKRLQPVADVVEADRQVNRP